MWKTSPSKLTFTPMAGMPMRIMVAPVTDTLTPFLLKPELTCVWSNRIWGCVEGTHGRGPGQQGLPSGLGLPYPKVHMLPLGSPWATFRSLRHHGVPLGADRQACRPSLGAPGQGHSPGSPARGHRRCW